MHLVRLKTFPWNKVLLRLPAGARGPVRPVGAILPTAARRAPSAHEAADGYTVPQAPAGSPDSHQFYILKRNICVSSY